MSEQITPSPDPLGELLAPPPPGGDDRLCGDLRERTSRVVRWRRRRRVLVHVAALAACYAAGLLTMNGIAPHAPPPPSVADNKEAEKEHRTPEESAVTMEWHALESSKPQADLYRRAGDRYLSDEADPESALRCYGQALDEGGAADRAVALEDSWLLMAIKNARQKENSYATNRN